ncbi:hypothetical protein M422DRAFT_272208 [Sphaerobolus stellatus SS14]|uniref:Uncharacterized protein n=1 Tax=Sphaerobolus stellatus (strain SS14) TaxID=990650 RepID=A0A0C9TXY8_SPHS4|nr:hypothetical protein M422DRAFT_272208 [Sphaerobolus stellatus SS14]
MSKPLNAECVIDRGISASPEAEQPMVGLWNLTNVDASFAQAGTNTSRLFNVGTLADYGAVSAEYPIDCASVIQMRYHMAYNLIFEIVRGNIQFPENSDAIRYTLFVLPPLSSHTRVSVDFPSPLYASPMFLPLDSFMFRFPYQSTKSHKLTNPEANSYLKYVVIAPFTTSLIPL